MSETNSPRKDEPEVEVLPPTSMEENPPAAAPASTATVTEAETAVAPSDPVVTTVDTTNVEETDVKPTDDMEGEEKDANPLSVLDAPVASAGKSTGSPPNSTDSGSGGKSHSSGHPNSKPGMYEDPRNLIVNYIPTPVTDPELRALFEQYGEIESARVILDRVTTHPKGYGFVKFKKEADAKNAMESMNGFEIHNKRLKVTMAKGPHNAAVNTHTQKLQQVVANAQAGNQLPPGTMLVPAPQPMNAPPVAASAGAQQSNIQVQYIVINSQGQAVYNQLGNPPPAHLFQSGQQQQPQPQPQIWQPPQPQPQQQQPQYASAGSGAAPQYQQYQPPPPTQSVPQWQPPQPQQQPQPQTQPYNWQPPPPQQQQPQQQQPQWQPPPPQPQWQPPQPQPQPQQQQPQPQPQWQPPPQWQQPQNSSANSQPLQMFIPLNSSNDPMFSDSSRFPSPPVSSNAGTSGALFQPPQ